MGSILFGNNINMLTVATPSSGFLVGYDLDGILKQKDEFGIITEIGGGLTAGSGTPTLSSVLLVGNKSGTSSIVMSKSTVISTENGGGQINLDYNFNKVLISTDNAALSTQYLQLSSGDVKLADYSTNGYITLKTKLSSNETNDSFIAHFIKISNGYRIGYESDINNSYFGYSSDNKYSYNIITGNTFSSFTSSNSNIGSVIISSKNSYVDVGVYNTAIIAGDDISAKHSNVLYTSNINIKNDGVIKGIDGSSELSFTEYNSLIANNGNSLISIISSSESNVLSTNGIIVSDTATGSHSPNINSSVSFISTKSSYVNYGIYNSVVIGGQTLNATQSDTVYLGNNVNINNAYTLPSVDGVAGYVLRTDGSGNVSWQVEGSSQNINEVLSVGNNTGIYSIIMGTATSIYSLLGGQIDFSYSNSNAILISTDSGMLSKAYILLDNNDITINSQYNLNIGASATSIITDNLQGFVYGADYSSTFVTYSLVDKNYVDYVISPILSSISSYGYGNIDYLPIWTGTNSLTASSLYSKNNSIYIGSTYSPQDSLDWHQSFYSHYDGFKSTGVAGFYSSLIGTSSTYFNFVSFINSENNASNSGFYSFIIATASESSYGVNVEVSGSNNNVGIRSSISGTSGTNYGIYIDSYNADVNYGVVVNKGTSIFNDYGDDYDFIVKGVSESNLLFIDASTNNIGVGTNSPDYKLEVSGTVSSIGFQMTNGASAGYILTSDSIGNAIWTEQSEIWTIELMDLLTVDFYTPYLMSINSITNLIGTPSISIDDDGVSYTLGNPISGGSKITVTSDVETVINLNAIKI